MSAPHALQMPPPDPEGVPCCLTAAYSGGESCTCWEPVYRPEPSTVVQPGPAVLRPKACRDCAFRPDSPERVGAGGDLPESSLDKPFWCHDGMPRLVGYTHPWLTEQGVCLLPTFREDWGDYDPHVTGTPADPRPWQADGQPAVMCRGWAVHIAGITRA